MVADSERELGGRLEADQVEGDDGVVPIELLIAQTETTYPAHLVAGQFKDAFRAIGVDEYLIRAMVLNESPATVEGDVGIHCGVFAKEMRKNPVLIAQELVEELPVDPDEIIEEFVAVGPYINARINHQRFANLVRDSVFEMGADYGKERLGTGQRVIIDMSSPNIAKRMNVGHLRSTIIGDSLARIFKHLDFEVIKDNHLGDWGTQFGHLLRAIELWGDEAAIAENPVPELHDLYIRINELIDPGSARYRDMDEAEAQRLTEELKAPGREWFRRLEEGDPEVYARWQQIVEWSLEEFQRMYDVLGIDFDWVRGESYYQELLQDTIQTLKDSGVTTESDGALVVDMEDAGLGTALVQKSDGATLYLTREIATGIHRSEEEHADHMIYVVGEDQRFYFEQFFEILRRMGYQINSKHVYFGLIRLPGGKMSSRRGRFVALEDVIEEAMDTTRDLANESIHVTDPAEREKLAHQVAIGALKWNDLMADPKRSYVYNKDAMLSSEGNSAPYVQYAYARAMSLIEGINMEDLSQAKIIPSTELERKVMQLVAAFPEAVRAAAEAYSPSKIAGYTYELAKAFNDFYNKLPILREEDEETRLSRLAITTSAAQTIQTGLELLGIEAPMRM